MVVRLKAYVTFYYQDGLFVRLDKISGTLTNKGFSDYVNMRLAYGVSLDFGYYEYEDTQVFPGMMLNNEYSLPNSAYPKYIRIDHIPDQIAGHCYVYINREVEDPKVTPSPAWKPDIHIKFISAEIRDFCYSFLPG